MPVLRSLQITSAGASAPLTPEHRQFNTLIRQIGQAREALALWRADIDGFRLSYQRVVLPLRAQCHAVQRDWLRALDGLLHQPGWSRAEVDTLRERVVETAGGLLDQAGGADAELKALFARHGEHEDDTARQRARQAMKQRAEAMTGLDPGDDEGIRSPADRLQRLRETLAAQQADEVLAGRRPRHPKVRAAKQREADALQASQSVRDIYRKLASALHPDRETDAARREAKTTLMQRVNLAYAASDLLALLELQLEIEQVDAGHIAQASTQRVKHYNKVLAEQLVALKNEIARVELGFRHEFGVPPTLPARPGKLGPLISQQAAELRAAVAGWQSELRLFKDRTATRRWIKRQTEALRQRRRDDDLF